MNPAALKSYLSGIEQALRAGNATEHTHRPALKTLIEQIATGITATNEPKRIKCGAPDYIVTRGTIPLGYIEAKDVGVPLDGIESGEQLKRYRESLANLILTDYLEFRWYVTGEHRLTVKLAKPDKTGKLKLLPDAAEQLGRLLDGFLNADIPVINNPRELAIRMAAMARLIRSIISKTFAEEENEGALHQQMQAFQKVLLNDMTPEQFGDMYAQTICYGLFAARCNARSGERFTRAHAAYDLPKTNPFLRKMFGHVAGPELDERIVWAVDDLAELLAKSDIGAILQDFGRHTRQEDPVVHFYETFLGHYDAKMREARGVYYTPEPVVSYIVRSVDCLLKSDFKLAKGLADATKIKIKRPIRAKKAGKTEFVTVETHKVQILDPATGTGTFLYSVVEQIRATFTGNAGMWPGYVAEHLLPRIYGFELLMAPYAVAHMKLGLQLKESGYDFEADERLRVYLTNTLEEAHEMTGLPLFTQWLAEEANSAATVKRDSPIMVVLGNPPYSGLSANTGEWIAGLLRGIDSSTGQKTSNYFEVDGQPLNERKHWLNDDYVKFIRFAQWRIEQTGYGVLAFVTNHGYLDNASFRGMRQSLMQSFDDIYLLDLHGNSKKKEKAPDGGKDENVFDIQQGVAIGLFVKRGKTQEKPAQIYHADLYGIRESKYIWLAEKDFTTTQWETLLPQAPHYLFVPQDIALLPEYEQGWKITDVMPINSSGIVTARDSFVIDFDESALEKRICEFTDLSNEDNEIRQKYFDGKGSSKYVSGDTRGWKLSVARTKLAKENWKSSLGKVLYRPFDRRSIIYSPIMIDWPRPEVMSQMQAGGNLALVTSRMTKGETFQHTQVTRDIVEVICMSPKTSNNGFVFPLYLYPATKNDLFDNDNTSTAPGGRSPNLAPEFIADFSARLKLAFVSDECGDLRKAFGPEDVFHYAYAVFHSPTYRSRYTEYLKIDFPRLPLTHDVGLFRSLCALGKELVALHLMETIAPTICHYPVAGDNKVETVRYADGRVYINAAQYFEGVPDAVWGFHVGGYQVAHKWLKDRKGRQLNYDDLTHYQQVMATLAETIRLQAAIDQAITKWPIQ